MVVQEIDRLSRSLLDFASLMERFRLSGAYFVSVTQPFLSADNDAMAQLLLSPRYEWNGCYDRNARDPRMLRHACAPHLACGDSDRSWCASVRTMEFPRLPGQSWCLSLGRLHDGLTV